MCRNFSLVRSLALVALFGLALAGPAVAQTGLATVTGIVHDESGGAVPGVTVTARNQETNVAYVGVTNSAGNYVINAVPIGSYVVSVELTGFKAVQSRVARAPQANIQSTVFGTITTAVGDPRIIQFVGKYYF